MSSAAASGSSVPGYFPETRWSLVAAAQGGDGNHGSEERARSALGELLGIYWPAVFIYGRARGYGEVEAQDFVQSFFLHLIKSEALASVDRSKGRLRTFLLVAVRRFLINDRAHDQTLKRGGGVHPIPLDEMPSPPPEPGLSPEAAFDRQWALTLLARTLAKLRDEYASSGRADLFAVLEPALTIDQDSASCAELARSLDLSAGALRVSLHRLRRRYRDLLRQEIGETVISPDAADEELQHLREALRDGR